MGASGRNTEASFLKHCMTDYWISTLAHEHARSQLKQPSLFLLANPIYFHNKNLHFIRNPLIKLISLIITLFSNCFSKALLTVPPSLIIKAKIFEIVQGSSVLVIIKSGTRLNALLTETCT